MRYSRIWAQSPVLCLFAVCFLLNSQQVQAQKAWTLKECVDYALENSISIKQSKISLEIAEGNKDQAMAGMFPNLNGNASQNFFYGRSLDPTTQRFTNSEFKSSNFSLSSQLIVFDGLQLQNSLRQSKLNYLSERYDLQKAADDISLNVIAAFLQVLYSQEAVQNAEIRKQSSEEQVKRIKKLVDAGSMPQGGLLDIESQLSTDELAIVTASNAWDNATLALLQLLNLDTVAIEQFTIEVPTVDLPDMSVLSTSADAIYAQALTSRPEVKSAETSYESAIMGLKTAKGGRYPTLSIGGSIASRYSSDAKRFDVVTLEQIDYPFNDQLDDNFNQNLGVNLSLPIFNGWFTRNNISQAKLGVESAALNTAQIKNTLRQSVQSAHLDAQSASKTYDARKKAVDALQESFIYTDKRFGVGLSNSLEFLTAKNNLAIAESDLLQAKYELIFRIKVLDFYLGNEITY